MKIAWQYVLAGLLVLASVPVYVKVYERYSDKGDGRSPAPAVVVRDLVRPTTRKLVMSRNEDEALNALMMHQAKCVSGVVYRTADHVIEPWPGRVRCVSDLDNTWSGVVPASAN